MNQKTLFYKGVIDVHSWCLEIWGDYACFTRPEMKVERVSYDMITPSAARAIFESILWKPAMKWNVTKIEVLNPIKWTSVRRNEVGKTASLPTSSQMSGNPSSTMGIYIEDYRQQRAGLILKDVRYRIHGYFDFIPPENRKNYSGKKQEVFSSEDELAFNSREDEKEAKYAAMFERRAKKGQCFHRPYLGCREFSCQFKLIDELENSLERAIEETRDLGYMLYDMDFEGNNGEIVPLFFRAKLESGVVYTDRREMEVIG